MHKEFFPAERLSAQHADRYQRLEIAGSGLATGDFRIDEIRYAAVGLLENDVHQFAAVDLGKSVSYVIGGVGRESADCADLPRRPCGRIFYCPQHVEQPRLPGTLARDREQQAVVIRLVRDDVSTWVKDRQWQQALLDQEKAVPHASGFAVAGV